MSTSSTELDLFSTLYTVIIYQESYSIKEENIYNETRVV